MDNGYMEEGQYRQGTPILSFDRKRTFRIGQPIRTMEFFTRPHQHIMEKPQFNLQQAISQTISHLQELGSITISDYQELRAHLEDSTEMLISIGLSEEEAFLIAQKRLGHPQVLTEEYAKVNHSLRTDKTWALLLAGFVTISMFIALISDIGSIFYYFLQQMGISHYTWLIAGYLCI